MIRPFFIPNFILVFSIFLAITEINCRAHAKINRIKLEYSDSIRFNWLSSSHFNFHCSTFFYSVYGKDQESIYIFNKYGDSLAVIKNKGEGPDQYKRILKFAVLDDSTVTVLDREKGYRYNWDGSVKEKYDFTNDFVPVYSQSEIEISTLGELILSISPVSIMHGTKSFFEHSKNLLRWNTSSHKMDFFCPYEQKSIYQKYLFPVLYNPKFSVFESKVYVLYPFQKLVFVYDLKSLKLIETISLDIPGFGKIKHINGDDPETQLYIMQINPSFQQIKSNNKYFVSTFFEAKPDSEIETNIFAVNKSSYKRKTYLTINDHQGNFLFQKDLSQWSNYSISLLQLNAENELTILSWEKKSINSSEEIYPIISKLIISDLIND